MFSRLILLFFTVLLTISCKNERSNSSKLKKDNTPKISYSFLNSYPHDKNSFTEGFLMHDGELFESSGSPDDLPQTRSLFGIVDLETGEIDVKVELDRNQYFGEGITFLNGQIFQLTYKSKTGFIYNAKTYKLLRNFTIPTKEGWGMTTDGKSLIMSDGTNKLTYLDPVSLKVTKSLSITENGFVKSKLNELEYIDGYIYANIWMTNTVVKVDPNDGKIIGKLDFSSYANEAKSIYPEALEMNGIAYDSLSGSIYITGKLWPKIYKIKIQHQQSPKQPV